VAFLGYIGVAPVLERFAQLDIPHHERITIWKATWRAFLDFPVFGSGFGTYEHAFKLYHPPTWFFYDMAHNDYLQLLMEAGVVGTAFVGAFLFFVARTITGAEWTQREVYLKGAFFASFTTIAVHSAVDFNLHIPSNAILLALLLGLSVSMSRLNEEEE
jgi:O-antigen ligase